MLEFKRYFTTGIHPYETVSWKMFTAEIKDAKGKTVFKQENVEFPDFWSQTAVNITASKYFFGKIGSSDREFSLKQLVDRVVNTIVTWGSNGKYLNEETESIFRDELKYMLIYQMASFNSPVWFNVGNPYSHPQISACFIVGVDDNMESILQSYVTEGLIYKNGSGSGINYSNLRSSKEYLSGGGKASGPCTFMQPSDSVAKVIKSGGKTRRAAQMKILNADHGDVIEFINQKTDEENKAKALIEAGWDSYFDNPKGAYGSVFFQNSNQSVRVTDEFMHAVENNEKWALLERRSSELPENQYTLIDTSQGKMRFYDYRDTTGGAENYIHHNNGWYKVIEFHMAKDLLRLIAQKAWETGDPGIQFHDTINFWHTCIASGIINGSNPCSEYMFLDDTSCNLASHRLTKYLNGKNEFDIDGFTHGTRILITAMDILIDNAHYPTEKIAAETKKYRTLGLGYSDLGALLMLKGLPYDSNEGRDYAAAITALMHSIAYDQSSKLAEALSPFAEFEKNKRHMNSVIDKHYKAIQALHIHLCVQTSKGYTEEIYSIAIAAKVCLDCHDRAVTKYRNAQVTVMAPTGTISFMMDCDTTGIEPMLGLVQYKTLAGGGTVTIIPACVKQALQNLGYGKTDYLEMLLKQIQTGKPLSQTDLKDKHYSIFATSFGEKNIIPYSAHIEMMAAIQPFLSGAISKTINMPNNVTVEEIEQAYIYAWKIGLKSVAIYRDGCKRSQPLNTKKEDKTSSVPFGLDTKDYALEHLTKKISEHFSESKNDQDDNVKSIDEFVKLREDVKTIRCRLPNDRNAFIHRFQIAGHKGYLKTGLYDDGSPGEIFVNISKEGSTISGLVDNWAILFSIALQYGVPIEFLIDKFENTKFEPSGFTNNPDIRSCSSIIDYICRYLRNKFLDKSFIKIEEKKEMPVGIKTKTQYTGDLSTCCGELLMKTGSCSTCTACGNTNGCG